MANGATTGTYVDPMAGKQLGTESSLSSWAGPYVTDMLGRGQALSNMPYQQYTGPLTAGASNLQSQAFSGLANLTLPSASYAPTSFSSGFDAQAPYQAGTFGSQFSAPKQYQTGTFGNQFSAPGQYQAGTFEGGTFTPQSAAQYMNPYLQQSLDPQLREAARQAEIMRVQNAGRMTQAGAYGGGRQAIMESELNRNTLQQLADITGRGYNTAYSAAEQAFERDQARRLQAAGMGEASRQFGAGQAMTAADLAARYGLEGQRAGEQSRQFGAGQAMTAADLAARYGLEGQRAGEQSRQFGAQFGLSSAEARSRAEMEAQRAAEASKQFGANYGLSALQSNLGAIGAQLGAGGTQRGIESEGVAADIAQFEQERDYPYKQVQYAQSLLQGLPLATQSYSYQEPSGLTSLLGGLGGLGSVLDIYGLLDKFKTPQPD
jgi:hypothetical protein